jgi:RHS repeat-associated protein
VVQAGDTTTWAYGWDALDRLVSVWREGVLIARYGYDVVGRRIAKRVYSASSGGTVGYTRFSYAGDHVAFEADSAGTIGRTYLWGVGTDHLVGVREANGTHYVAVTDKLGSVRALVRRADGVWTGSLRFDPYGALIDTAGSVLGLRYRWTGREWDAETGFYFHRARYYDPGAKRFISEDPIGFAGGENLYAYVGGAVLETRDPAGLSRATLYPRGFMAMCTTMGSCMDWTGSVTRDDYSAAEALIDWGASAYVDHVLAGLYETYKEQYQALRAEYMKNPNLVISIGSGIRITADRLFEGAVYLSEGQFKEVVAVWSGASGNGKLLGEDIMAQFGRGLIFFNDRFVTWASRQQNRKETYGYSFTSSRGHNFSVLGAIARNSVGWAVGHETLHFYGDLGEGNEECIIDNRLRNYIPASSPPAANNCWAY